MSIDGVLIARLAGVALGFPLLAFAFGWSVLGRFTDLDREERFAASWGVSFAVLALARFLAFVLHADPVLAGVVTVLLMLLAAALLYHPVRGVWFVVPPVGGLRVPGPPTGGTTNQTASSGPWISRGGWGGNAVAADLSVWPLAALWALAYLHLLCIQALLPNYRGSDWYFDWWMHYDEALVFVGDRDVHTVWSGTYTLASRTPLYNLTGAAVLALAGHDFGIFQAASALTDGCVVLVVYVLLRELFDRRAARLGLLLAALNLWLLHNAWFTWPKMLAAYYILLGLYFYVRSVRLRPDEPRRASRLFVAFGLSALLGFMTHQVALVYVAPLLMHAAYLTVRRGTYRATLRELALLTLAAALTAGAWYGWLAETLGTRVILGTTPVTQGDTSAVFRLRNIAEWVSMNLGASVVPVLLLGFWLYVPFSWTMLYRGLTELYFSLFTGALTMSLSAFLAALVRRLDWAALVLLGLGLGAWGLTVTLALRQDPRQPVMRMAALTVLLAGLLALILLRDLRQWALPAGRWPEWQAVCLFLALGTLGAAVLHPGKILHGIAHSACFPSALLLAALGWGVLSRATPRAAAVVCTGIVAEFQLMFWSHWWFLTHLPEVLEELPGNDLYKDPGVVFLNDGLGAGQYVFLGAAVLVQLLLCALLVRELRCWGTTEPAVKRDLQTGSSLG
jgi:hypothetical protein